MFSFLKRRAAPTKKPVAQRATGKPSVPDRARGWTQPSPLDRPTMPEVHERDDESVWDDWEHSQMELDSRMGPLSAYDTIRVREPVPSQNIDLDPFTAIRGAKQTGRLR